MSEELSGIELRKALAVALGYYIAEEDGELYLMKPLQSIGSSHGMKGTREAIESALWAAFCPAFESDPAVSEQTLDAECKKRGWLWEVGNTTHPERHKAYYCELQNADSHGDVLLLVFGATPSDVRARALLKALQASDSEPQSPAVKET